MLLNETADDVWPNILIFSAPIQPHYEKRFPNLLEYVFNYTLILKNIFKPTFKIGLLS